MQSLDDLKLTTMQRTALTVRLGCRTDAEAGDKLDLTEDALRMRINRALASLTEEQRASYLRAIARVKPHVIKPLSLSLCPNA